MKKVIIAKRNSLCFSHNIMKVFVEMGYKWAITEMGYSSGVEYCYVNEFDDDSFSGFSREDERIINFLETTNIKYIDGNDDYRIIEIPKDVEYYVGETDMGREIIVENHRRWI